MSDELKTKVYSKITLLTKGNIPDKNLDDLHTYIYSLDEEKLKVCLGIAQKLFDQRCLGFKSSKVSLNAIKLCVKLSQYGYYTFPYIEKLATKGWSTSGGTYSFSMPLIGNDANSSREIFSYGPIDKLVSQNTKLDIGNNNNARCLEVDYK